MTDLSEYINIEHRGDCSVMIVQGQEFIFGGPIQFYRDYTADPRDVFVRYRFEVDLYHDTSPEPPKPKRRQSTLGLRRPK